MFRKISMRKKSLWLSIALSFILSISFVSAVSIKVDNYKGNYGVGSTLDVRVYLDGYVNDLKGFQFDLYWNKNVLKCTSATSYPNNFWSNPYMVGEGLEEGHYFIGYSGLNEKYTGSGKTLAMLKFKVVGIGLSSLDLRNTLLLSAKDHSVSVIRFETIDGIFDNTVIQTSTTPVSYLNAFIRMILGLFR